ncbi:MAG: sugar-binding domain-containing protein [Bacteroidota bacterium]
MKQSIYYFLLLIVVSGTAYIKCNDQKTIQYKSTLSENWKIQSSKELNVDGDIISSLDYNDSSWYDALVPSTVFIIHANPDKNPKIYKEPNLIDYPKEQINSSRWYRVKFNIENKELVELLEFEGINSKANIWINGKKIASTDKIPNVYGQFRLQINKFTKQGANVLAIEVFPPKTDDFSVGYVDWNLETNDDIGIFRNVNLLLNNGVSIANPYILAKFNNNDYNQTDLYFSVNLQNHWNIDLEGVLNLKIGNVTIKQKLTIRANEKKIVTISARDNENLNIKKSKLLQSNNIGNPILYKASVEFLINGRISDITEFAIKVPSNGKLVFIKLID